MRRLTKLASILGAAALMATTTVYAAADMANGKKIYAEGKGSVPACSSCHGEKGMGNDMLGTPRLAGQVVQFLVKQLEDFATDKRMDTTMFVMNANAKGLSAQDRIDVAYYMSKQMTTFAESASEPSNLAELKENGVEVGSPYLGKIMVKYGLTDRDIPACKSCHGFNGRGAEPVYPKINEQKYSYLVSQLKKWRDGSRNNDPMSQMQVVARQLTDEDINNAAAYLTSAPQTTDGNSRAAAMHEPKSYSSH